MPLETLSAGNTYAMTQNVVYALPAHVTFLIANEAVEFSLVATTGFAAVAASSTGMVNAYAFVRATTTTARISVKRY